ncbi:AAA family ATPase [Sinorhizobium sp. BJ1]|uniref:AAA family ATPase n=1 Tax=Sinorhizobium sp. BJ1 TaxID=2035455 RepID=UPI001FE1442B|nr:AAA family ATPase [Sinorhizobium sp. BJ1]
MNLAILESNSINVRIIEPHITTTLTELVDTNPALALIGPRQVGKTTLALAIAERRPSIYLDLESDADRAKLSEPGSTSSTTWTSSSFSMKFIASRTSFKTCVD